MKFCVFGASGGEAMDTAIKSARHATGRRKIISLDKGYNGRTGLSGAAGNAGTAGFFRSDAPVSDAIRKSFHV